MIFKGETISVYENRKSGIELLKIIGIFLVIISHVTQTLGTDMGSVLGYNDYYIDLNKNTHDLTTFILIALQHSGQIGNTIFFVCSAWFLFDKNTTNYKKVFRIICDVFVISLIWLISFIAVKGVNYIGVENVKHSLLPSYFSNNWYVTNYIIFCFIAPLLNLIINNISQKKHFAIMLTLSVCYLCISYVYMFPNTTALIVWISFYFIVTYFKIYCKGFCKNVKLNLIIFLITFLGFILLLLITNFMGLKIAYFANQMLRWLKKESIINFIIAFSLFNVFNALNIKNKFINYVSSCSLLIYIIHENILFRTYIRPYIWQQIFTKFGFNMIMPFHICYVLGLFVFSFFIASLYKTTIQKPLYKISDKIYVFLSSVIKKIAGKIYKRLR